MRTVTAAILGVALVAVPGTAGAHDKDHPAPGTALEGPVSTAFNAGGEGAEWELVTSIVTGNPHTDLDYFTIDGDTYMSAGTLAVGPNGGGQTIVRLTEDGELAPSFVAGHPSAACTSDPNAALGLQHDVEATPKGDVPYNVDGWNGLVDRDVDAQLLLDATDAAGRCHDGGPLGGLSDAPRGGLEIIDVTDPAEPVELVLTSHIGEAHTVNVDPSRPHIAYVVSSDSVSVSGDQRTNESDGSSYALDGFEIVDLSSCMGFEEGTSVAAKREACQPEVFRYRYEDLDMVRGHTNRNGVYGCHELELHPGDLLTCASGSASMLFDVSGLFATDGSINGTPLPCERRESTSLAPFATGAAVIDCVEGADGQDLRVQPWIDELDAPSAEGIEWQGSAYHMGREALVNSAVAPAYPSTEDIDFSHEAELTHSGDFMIASDERGGGVAPGGASCSPGANLEQGNGGLHAYRVDALRTTSTDVAEEAWESYARDPEGDKAIARAPVNTQPQGTECTAHVFQQVPGQNRIFMGWYSQGTQVFDYVEHEDGTFEWHHVGYFVPEHANTWVSHIFDVQDNEDGTFTYLGATGDFNVGNGRGAVDIYRVTLPEPRQFSAPPDDGDESTDPDEGDDSTGPECDADRQGKGPRHCEDGAERPGNGEGAEQRDDRSGGNGNGDDGAADEAQDGMGSEPGVTATGTAATTASTPAVIDLRDEAVAAGASAAPIPAAGLALAVGLALWLAGLLGGRRPAPKASASS